MHNGDEPIGLRDKWEYNQDFKLDWHDGKEAHDGYQLKWVGKNYARLQTGTKTETVIIPDTKHNEKEINQNSENLFFTGDNLEVLKDRYSIQLELYEIGVKEYYHAKKVKKFIYSIALNKYTEV